jgi:serine/threonine-protein kinase RsbW
MNSSHPKQILGRLSDDEFFNREAEAERLYAVATSRRASSALLLGPRRVGKTELLRRCFDRLFDEGAVAPFYYALRPYSLDSEAFARDYLSQFLAQFIAFRRNDARLIAAADEPLAVISRAAMPEDYLWVRAMIDSLSRASASGDGALTVRSALAAPSIAASRAQQAVSVMVDNFHLLAEDGAGAAGLGREFIGAEFIRALTAASPAESVGAAQPSYILCGAQRLMVELMPAEEELFGRLELIRVERMGEGPLEQIIRSTAGALKVEVSDSTAELMIHQLNRDLFYSRALIDAAAARGSNLKTFMEFERVYTEEVLGGRISHYIGALLRDVAKDSRSRRAALEALALAIESSAPIPIEAVIERVGEHAPGAEELLARLNSRELLEINYGFVSATADAVLADYVRAKYRSEVAGARPPVAGQQLLGEKLKHSYRLMMSRYNRAVEAQLVELLSQFDFQGAPASLFDQPAFDRRYRGMSRVQERRALDEEKERVRLPQIVLVNDAGAGEQAGISWRLFAASGFEGGIYSEANEVAWLIALVNSKEPLDLETLNRIDQRLEAAARAPREGASGPPRVVRWYISKEGFSAVAGERLASLRAYRSTYAQLDLLSDYIKKIAAADGEDRPASQFELVIPIEDDAELIAARTVEQIARTAEFEQEAINQIKTALIEACINAAEHSESPDRRIYQRFAIEDDRLTITVTNRGKTCGAQNGESNRTPGGAPHRAARGRGLQIIRKLMDEVKFDRTDDGASLVMTKYLKRPPTTED